MSRGPGRIHREIIAAFGEPGAPEYTVQQLAERIFSGVVVGKPQTDSVNRALNKLAPVLGLKRYRVGAAGQNGWHHLWAHADNAAVSVEARANIFREAFASAS